MLAAHGVTLAAARTVVVALLGPPTTSGGFGIMVFMEGGDATAGAEKALRLAQAEAKRLRHHYFGSEHLLLGLIAEREGIAARTLTELGVELEPARRELERLFDERDLLVTGPEGDRVKGDFLQRAGDEARRLNQSTIDTEHLLLGLLDDRDGLAVPILEHLGAGPDAVRAAVERRIRAGQ